MAVTGLILVGFLFGHSIGNLQYLLGPEAYNNYAAMLQSNKEFLWIIRGTLLLCLVLHVISAISLRFYNNAAKPIKYKVTNYAKAKLTSRTMLWTGMLLLAGITYHILHFTAGKVDFEGGYESHELHQTGYAIKATEVEYKNVETLEANAVPVVEKRHDVYTMVTKEFANPLVVISYVVFVALVMFHLNHAIQSAIHTVGIQGPKLSNCLRKCSVCLSVILFLLFITLPVSVLLGVGSCAGGGCL